jgi:hypothetical protein
MVVCVSWNMTVSVISRTDRGRRSRLVQDRDDLWTMPGSLSWAAEMFTARLSRRPAGRRSRHPATVRQPSAGGRPRSDRPALLGDRDELVRTDQATRGMTPSDERLDLDISPVASAMIGW